MSNKKVHEDQKYIDGLVNNNSFIIQTIYDKFVPKVINYVKQNSGDEEYAQDVVQDTIITIYNQAIQKNLQLTCPFDAYFFLLCKRKWLNTLKKTNNKEKSIYRGPGPMSLGPLMMMHVPHPEACPPP